MKYLVASLLALVIFSGVHAQEKKLVQFSGIIYNADSVGAIVPYVTITNKSQKSVSYPANYQGYFSFVAHETDTIVFSSVGYRREQLIIPANLPERKYTMMIKLKPDVINLPVVRVYPWATVDEFTRQFLAMKLAADDQLIAKRNVSRESLAAMGKYLPRDAGEMHTIDFQNAHVNLSNAHMNQRASNPLLNPFAWASFIQQITQGDKSRGKGD